MTARWTSKDIGDQTGRVVIVTGSNSGIGFETARELARKGAHVVMAYRSADKGEQAASRIRQEDPAGVIEVARLDLASLESVREFAEGFLKTYDRLDILVANAGVMMPPARTQTSDGFELQMGTNHLGHFALVGLLQDSLVATRGSRVVVVSSMAHKYGEIDLEDLNWETRPYARMKCYGQSKLANLLFAYELQRRLERAGADTIVAAAHPGWTATNLQKDSGLFRLLNPVLAMKPWQGALPTLYAATAPDVRGGDYFGPGGFQEMRGYPRKVTSTPISHDADLAARLWQASEKLTGVTYEVGAS